MNFLDIKSGTTAEGDEIKAYRSEKKASRYLYLMAGVHGDEVEGVYVLDQLFNWLKDNDQIDLPIIVIPILNGDGYRAGTRTNAHGVDLNRNLPSANWTAEARDEKYYPGASALSEPENIYLDKLFNKYTPGLIFSFHSWKPMLNYNGNCKEIAKFLEQYNGYPSVDDIEGHPTPGSLGEYGPEKYKAPVLTFEFPLITEGHSLSEIWQENAEGLTKLFETDLLAPHLS